MLHDVDLSIAPALADRRRRRDRVGQVDAGQAADPAHGPDRGHGAGRRRRPAPGAVLVAARPGGAWCRRRASSSTPRCWRTSGSAGPRPPPTTSSWRITELGLDAWLAGLPHGLATEVGQRGESLSAGERQLVALARAYLADPDLLVLDEATSAVDPSTEVRLQRALEGLTRGRTSIAIAHRLSTAEAADEVVVVDRGRIVERGPHRELVAAGGVYAGLHASWAAQQRG